MSKAIKTAIINTAEFYGRQISESGLSMYAEDLEGLDEGAVLEAYKRYRRNPANRQFPLPAQIRELVNPEQFVAVEAQAREIAVRIVGAVKRFGYTDSRGAELFIGPIGWAAIRRRGGWTDLCESLGSEINEATFQAQMRDLVESNLRYGIGTIEEQIGALPEAQARGGDLVSIGEGIRALILERGPEDAA